MSEYHKIPTLWARQSEKPCDMILGEFATPELELLSGVDWHWEEKVDGTNIRVAWGDSGVRFGGKTDRAQIPTPLLDALTDLFPAEKFADFDAVTLYGEGYGAGIQKGGGNYKPDGADFVLFDVRINDLWLERGNVYDIADKLAVRHVPEVGHGTLREASDFCAGGFTSDWGGFEAEGIVLRPQVELQTRRGHRVITKLKTKDFRKLEGKTE